MVSCKWESFFAKLPVAATVLLMVLTVRAEAQIGREAVERLTVMVEAATLQGGRGGAGIIIGRDTDALYVATTKHTLLIGDGQSPKVSVSVRWSPATPLVAERVNIHPKLDLAVLKVPVAPGLTRADTLWFSSMGTPARLNETDDLNAVGWPHYPDQTWESCSAWFSFRKLSEGNIQFDRGCFTEGHSGGPIVDQQWNIVGMGVGFSNDEGAAYSIDRVRSAVQEIAPAVPFTLTPNGPEAGRPFFTEVAGACGLTEAGKVYCWGDGAKNWTSKRCGEQFCGLVNVDTRLRFKSITAGLCGLTWEGRAYCWKTWSTGPAPFLPAMRFMSLNISTYHSCGITLDGDLYCWGDNRFGELGDGTTESRTEPVLVKGGMKWAFVEISGGLTCGITAENGMAEAPPGGKPTKPGKAYCWGDGDGGGLGGGIRKSSLTPAPVLYDRRFVGLSAGSAMGEPVNQRYDFVCGIDEDGRGVCWGRGANSGWFKDSSANRLVPQPIAWDAALTDVASSRDHACAISSDATLVCWGGQIDAGSVEEQDQPKLSLRKQLEFPQASIDAPPVRMKTRVPFSRITDDAQYGFTRAGDLYPIDQWGWRFGNPPRDGNLPVIASHCFAPPTKSFSSWFEPDNPFALSAPRYLFVFSGLSNVDRDGLDRAAARVAEPLRLAWILHDNCRLGDTEMSRIVEYDGLWRPQTEISHFDAISSEPAVNNSNSAPANSGPAVAPPSTKKNRRRQAVPLGPAPQLTRELTNSELTQLRALLLEYDRKSIAFAKWAKEVERLWER